MHRSHSLVPTHFSTTKHQLSHRIACTRTRTRTHITKCNAPIFVSRTSCVSPVARLPCRTPLVLTLFEFGASIFHQIGTSLDTQAGRLRRHGRSKQAARHVSLIRWCSKVHCPFCVPLECTATKSYCSSRALSDGKTHRGIKAMFGIYKTLLCAKNGVSSGSAILAFLSLVFSTTRDLKL